MKRWFRSMPATAGMAPLRAAQRRHPVKRRARLALAAVFIALPLGALGTQAGALTPWRTFGNGTARGLGNVGSGVVDRSAVFLDSVTRENPARIRIVVRGPSAGRANIRWHMLCANSVNDFAETRVFSFNAQLPHVVDLSNRLGGVSRWRGCFVDSQVTYSRPGAVTLLLQARY
jgi:hypothetical protein